MEQQMEVGIVKDEVYDTVYTTLQGSVSQTQGTKRKKKAWQGRKKIPKQPLSAKGPLQVLNEKFGKIEFEVNENVQDPNLGFCAVFQYDGNVYQGSGPSKKKAKIEAAKQCLIKHNLEFNKNAEVENVPSEPKQSFFSGSVQSAPSRPLQSVATGPMQPYLSRPPESVSSGLPGFIPLNSFENAPSKVPQNVPFGNFGNPPTRPLAPLFSNPYANPADAKDIDFSKDDPNYNGMSFFSGQRFKQKVFPMGELLANFHRLKSLQIDFNLQKAAEYPSMVLHELFPNINDMIVWMETGSVQKFNCKVTIHGHDYFGSGTGKRQAKHELAKSVLSAMFGITRFREFKAASSNAGGNALPLSKKHPYAQVKLVDPNAKYEFKEIKNESDEVSWEVSLTMNGKEFKASDKEKSKAKFQVSKKAFEEYKGSHPEETFVERKIDTSKNPIQMLHEFYNNIELIEENVLDDDGQSFLLGLQIDGKTFTAKGPSKKRAKLQLAIDVFKGLHQIDPSQWTFVSSEMKDDVEMKKPNTKKNPLSMLNELHPQLEYSVTEQMAEANKPCFTANIQFGETTFEGKGSTKKSAKADAASKVLEAVYNMKDADMTEDLLTTLNNTTDIENDYSAKIAQAVTSKFSQVFHSDTPYKVLAAIVMAKSVDGEMTDCFEVISIGTGTKCIGGNNINNAGQVLNDCHAEIIACRGLRQFLFDQLILAASNNESCLEQVGKVPYFQLKSNMHLYLYINTAPCGDGRVYNSTSVSSKNKTIGVLRTKIENGQGTVPVPSNKVQTTDGILEGERLLTMSCSDKIMKWNLLGLQGSILSLFMKPIYLKGIVIGDLYNYDHLTRSLFTRMQGLTGNVQPFQSTKPDFGHHSSTDGRDTSKATNNSYNWYYGQNTVEIINAVTGKTLVSTPSRLSKAAFFKKFRELEKLVGSQIKVQTYHEAKLAAEVYQTNKKLFFQHLEEQGYGKWVGKPIEQDTFS